MIGAFPRGCLAGIGSNGLPGHSIEVEKTDGVESEFVGCASCEQYHLMVLVIVVDGVIRALTWPISLSFQLPPLVAVQIELPQVIQIRSFCIFSPESAKKQ